MDRSKGIRKTVEEIFGGYALIQRSEWHKRENVVNYLPEGRQATFRKRVQRAYHEPNYEGAKRALQRVKKGFSLIKESEGVLKKACSRPCAPSPTESLREDGKEP